MSLPTGSAELAVAYQHCRAIARARARNFYYAFVALPAAKRDAICAVYAFMRRADDISDEPGESLDRRREQMQQWMATWKLAETGGATDDLVFIALRDAQRRFAIPSRWLDQLVQGTTLDLEERTATYETFDDLYQYCYLVASVVGLVCIRIFGYHDSAAEKLAEETGVAFQLTNILRDVGEDAAMGRTYLPAAMLRDAGAGDALHGVVSDPQTVAKLRAPMTMLGEQAEVYYASAQKLLPLVDADSRPALWVLVTIYHRLLQRVRANGYDVFSARIEVPPAEKLGILAQGLGKVLLNKLHTRV